LCRGAPFRVESGAQREWKFAKQIGKMDAFGKDGKRRLSEAQFAADEGEKS
jgi:hypothetical protein